MGHRPRIAGGTHPALLSLSDVPFAVTRGMFSRESGAADPVVIIRHSHETQLAPQGLRDPKSSGDASRLDVPQCTVDRSNSSDAVTPDAKRTLLVDVPQSSASLSPVVPPPRDLPEDDPDTLLQHARFLIKAGLAPIAKEPLQKVVKEAPGTPIARERSERSTSCRGTSPALPLAAQLSDCFCGVQFAWSIQSPGAPCSSAVRKSAGSGTFASFAASTRT